MKRISVTVCKSKWLTLSVRILNLIRIIFVIYYILISFKSHCRALWRWRRGCRNKYRRNIRLYLCISKQHLLVSRMNNLIQRSQFTYFCDLKIILWRRPLDAYVNVQCPKYKPNYIYSALLQELRKCPLSPSWPKEIQSWVTMVTALLPSSCHVEVAG